MTALAERLQPLINLFVAAARRDPSITVQQQVLVAATIFVLVALLVVIALILFAPKKRVVVRRRRVVHAPEAPHQSAATTLTGTERSRERIPSAAAPRRASAAGRLLLGPAGMGLVAVLLAVSAYGVTETNTFCTYRCHQDMLPAPVVVREAPATAVPLPTQTVSPAQAEPTHHERCASCHGADVISNVADRTRMLVASFAGASETSLSAVVTSARCLSCHRAVLDGVLLGSRDVRMSHAEPVAAGKACARCHQRTGHTGARWPQMTQCVECHDTQLASAQCDACHPRSPADRTTVDLPPGTVGKRVYALVQLSDDLCYGCHDPRPCDSCHGVRVPHTQIFLAERHARPAAWDGKRGCYRCHYQMECQKCHASFAGAHYDGWRGDHREASPDGCSCHDRRRPERGRPFCSVCHW